MTVSKLKVILITIGISDVLNSLFESSINIVGIIESKPRNSIKYNKNLMDFCLENDIPYYFMNEGCNDQLENWIKRFEPDLIVIVGMSELLKKNIIDIPNRGCINLHFSLLPKYRGSHPIFWTYYNFDLNPGVTVHYINEDEDSGDIINQQSYSLPLGSTEEEMIALCSKIGTELLLKSIVEIENNCESRICQPVRSPTNRARQIKPVEYKRLVNWHEWEIERTWHLLKGTQNWLNVFDFSDIKGNVLKWRILHYEKRTINSQLKLGKVYKGDNNYFVYCGVGLIYMELFIDIEMLYFSFSLLKNLFIYKLSF